MLTQAIQRWRVGKSGTQSQILGLEDQGRAGSVEEHFSTACSRDREREWTLYHGEDQVAVVRTHVWRSWQNRFRNLVYLLCGIVDFDMKALVYTDESVTSLHPPAADNILV